MNRLYVMAATAAAFSTALAADKVDFVKEIKPMFEKYCLSCHGETKPKGSLKMTTRELSIKGGDNGAGIVPGKPDESPIYTLTILPPDHDDVMPPKGDKLTKEENEKVKNWIAQGAEWPANEVLKQIEKPVATTDPVKEVEGISDIWKKIVGINKITDPKQMKPYTDFIVGSAASFDM